MIIPIRRFALGAALAVAVPALADDAAKPAPDAPKPPASSIAPTSPQMHSAGQVVAKLSKSGDDKITLKVPTTEQTPATRGRRLPGTHVVEKDHDYDLASDVKIRWHTLPKKPDGKPYTDQEYQALREPNGALGYKADKADLKPGQTVRLYLSKAGKDDTPVVTTVMILAEPPKPADKTADKSK
jgi:hypothetical protein